MSNLSIVLAGVMVGFFTPILKSDTMPVAVVDSMQDYVIQDKAATTRICLMYRNMQIQFQQFKSDVLADKIEYLSWDKFVMLQEGDEDPEVERYCNESGFARLTRIK